MMPRVLKKRLLWLSLCLNLALLAVGAWAVWKGGGLCAVWRRVWQADTDLYTQRLDHFRRLPAVPGAVVWLGDSRVALAEWHELLPGQTPMLNRGISADHVAGVHQRLDESVRHTPAMLYLWVGVNDLIFGKSPAETAALYRLLVQDIRVRLPQARVVVLGLPPVHYHCRNYRVSNADIRLLNQLLEGLAGEAGAEFVPLYDLLADSEGQLEAIFSTDGLHLNGQGYARVAAAINR
jgi:lysophospholipase L1-like esterase